VIIIEGPDGSGKSTLVNKLAQELRLPVADKVVASDTTAMTDLVKWTEDNVARGFQPTIFDRHRLISEPIYGPILKPRQDPSFCDLSWLSQQLWLFYGCKPVIIYCLPDIRTVRANVAREDTDNSVVASRIAAIYAAYVNRATLDFTRGVGRLYNYETTRFDDIVGWVNFKLDGRISTDDRVRLPFPRTEGIHSGTDDGGRRPAARRSLR
jgi:nicotinamide riboside kinase